MKSYVGIDIGHSQLKIAYVSGNVVKKTAIVPMPDSLVKDGRIVSVDACSEILKKALKDNKISVRDAALVIPEENILTKNTTMPIMSQQQFEYNLPFEFKDYISDETSTYFFDYTIVGEDKENKNYDVSAVAIKKAQLENYRELIKKSGLKLEKATHEIASYNTLIKLQQNYNENAEYCIVDLGYNAIRMYIFKGGKLTASKYVQKGTGSIELAIADKYGVDVHLAGTYLQTDYDNCRKAEEMVTVYDGLSLELLRVLNFYKFSNRDSELADIWVCGGGAEIPELVSAICETLSDLRVHHAAELYRYPQDTVSPNTTFLAAAVAMDGPEDVASNKKKKIAVKNGTINIARTGIKKKRYGLAIPGIIIIIILASLFSKVFVVDRLSEINSLESEYDDLKEELDMYYGMVDKYGDITDEYAHYTYQSFTSDELRSADRVEIINLINTFILPKADVRSWTVSGNILTVSIICNNLTEINAIASEINKEYIVDYCTVNTAITGYQNNDNQTGTGNGVNGYNYVSGTLSISFRDGTLVNDLGAAAGSGEVTTQDEDE